MKILFAASECVPYIKTGGLADVVGALAPVLAKRGHDVAVMIPKYGMIPDKYKDAMTHVMDFEVTLGWRKQYCGIELIEAEGVKWYFIDNEYYFKRDYVYGAGGDEYERYAFFDRAVLEGIAKLGFKPDILHAHDWQAGMIPALLKIQYSGVDFYQGIHTVYTIHNLQYQGIFGIDQLRDVLSLNEGDFTDDKLESFGCANFMKAALVYSDEITTVSPSYAEEIQTTYYGERMDGLLRSRRANLSGVLNGIDINAWNPADDALIPFNYSLADMSGRAACKESLQKELGLNVDPSVPVIGMVTRLSSQKGLDLVDHVIGQIMEENVQLVVLGMGESRYVNLFSWAEQQYPGRVAARFQMDNGLAHRIYAGADMMLMPSRFEPCGLTQMIALRYGCVPIVRETGGLRDTVLSYNHYNNAGNGFTFFNYNAHDMLFTIRRAVRYFREKSDVWQNLMIRGMEGDYSWTHSAEVYESLYASMLPGASAPVVEDAVEEVAAPVVEEAAPVVEEAAPAVEEAPAKPKRTRKPAAKKPAVEGEEAPAKPKRKPAAKKAAAEPVAVDAEVPAKPKRTRKPAAKKADAE